MPTKNKLFIGLMSGTSVDAIDTVLVQFNDKPTHSVELIATREHAFPPEIRTAVQTLIESPQGINLDELGMLDRKLGFLYADAVTSLLQETGTDANSIVAIGNHGQTIRHRPDSDPPFTMQIGDAATIANVCGITTIGDFRSADIALGGQGAPLAPLFHQWAFANDSSPGFAVNIGGIGNVTVMRPGESLIGFDTGPGNTLLDYWCQQNTNATFDEGGRWASSGEVQTELLETLLADPYFAAAAPKSTGREYFNAHWLTNMLGETVATDSVDVQATLAELTAQTIAMAIKKYADSGDVWLCGGGALNSDLTARIKTHLPLFKVATTATLGVPPAWVEAVAFAWLARERLTLSAAGIPSVTGASASGILGSVNLPAAAGSAL
jgi:anhydro-N-acetylmuramic acid kinase